MYFWLWIIILVAMAIIELMTFGLVSIWFCVGAIIALIVERLGLNFYFQIAFFFGSSLIFVLFFRSIIKKYFKTRNEATNYDRYLNKHFKLLTSIGEEAGSIKINDLIWSCVSNDEKPIEAGSTVEILAFEGSKIIVRRI